MSTNQEGKDFVAMPPAFPAPEVTGKLVLTSEHGITDELDVSVLNLQPGDVLVFQTERVLSMESAERIKYFADQALELERKNIKAIVLSEGVKIAGVLREQRK